MAGRVVPVCNRLRSRGLVSRSARRRAAGDRACHVAVADAHEPACARVVVGAAWIPVPGDCGAGPGRHHRQAHRRPRSARGRGRGCRFCTNSSCGGWSMRAFPSGHATTAFAAAIAFGALWPRLRPLLWTYAIVIALSRVIVTAHHPSDVVAGAIAGAVGALLVRDWMAARRLGFLVRPGRRRCGRCRGHHGRGSKGLPAASPVNKKLTPCSGDAWAFIATAGARTGYRTQSCVRTKQRRRSAWSFR